MTVSNSSIHNQDHLARKNHTPSFSLFDSALVWIISLFGTVAAVALLLVPHFFLPAEDAVILFQFSRNLAQTAAITFVQTGPRAEGATDFGWMVLLALGIKLGINPFWLVASINTFSLVLFACLLLKIARRPIRALPVLFIMGSFALMPQIFAATAGFSTLPFACLLTLLVFYFLRQNDTAMPVVALMLCLFRPDGVIFAVPLLAAALIIYRGRARRAVLDLGFFVLPGLIYFVWRWRYFGHLLPLPFLVKSDASRFAHLVVLNSVHEGKLFCLFALILLLFVLKDSSRDAGNRSVLLCLVLLPNLFYFAMRLDQNIGHRFFIYLPVGTAILIAMNWQRLRLRAPLLLRLGTFACLLFLGRMWMHEARNFWSYNFDKRRTIALDLAALPHGTLLTTEAGIVPFYSHWTAYDAWGLNTARFATQFIQPADVSTLQPDIILVYTGGNTECWAQNDWRTPYTTRTWQHMTRNLVIAADPSHYSLWLLPFGSSTFRAHQHYANWQGDHECWFLRNNSPLRSQVEAVLASNDGLTAAQFRSLVSVPLLSRPATLSASPDQRGAPTHSFWQSVRSPARRLWHFLDD